ncbi:hypothetical protein [Ammoniphilus sp. 3BR4]|uniref:hypothetical protein n=1 Tax=Ammoniphilus sp. 3BR4 TaxID=3158265 RepID=UPI0034676CC2
MHHLYLRKKSQAEQQRVQYTYLFDDHGLSPANQILTRLYRQMILAVEESLTAVEVEYVDIFLAKNLGAERAKQLLQLLGATKENIRENKKGEVVLSRSFRAPLTPEALHYFKRMQDLEELSAYALYSDQEKKVEVYFAKHMTVMLNPAEEDRFFKLLEEDRIRYKTV